MKNYLSLGLLLSFIFSFSCKHVSEDLHAIFDRYESFHKERNAGNDTTWFSYNDSIIALEKSFLDSLENDLASIDRSSLDQKDQINYDLFAHVLSNKRFNLDYESHLMPLNSEGGFLAGIVYRMRNPKLATEEDRAKFLAKLRNFPTYLDQQKSLMEKGLKTGKTVPKWIAQKALVIAEGLPKPSFEENIFYSPVQKLKDAGDYQKNCKVVIEESVMPACQDFNKFLTKIYIPQTRTEIGAIHLPEGKGYYEQRVRFFTTLDISPDSVFQTGQQEVQRIRAEMEQIIVDLDFEGSFADFLDFLRTDPQFYAQTPQELLNEAAWLSKKAEEILPRYFNKTPRMPFTVQPVPAAIAPNYTGGRYSEGSYKNHKPGAYWVNTYKLETRPLYVLPSLTLHEAVPGHHLQIMLSQELEDVPTFRRNTYLSAFGEGWALYTEFLGKEAGMYRTPYEDFGRLTYEMWRACRLVVDVGMHYKGWTRDQAVAFMANNTALSMHEVNTEIDRYIGWPAQAVSYKMGELTIRNLRKEAEERWGEDFDIRAFHDLVLAHGSIPMQSLKEIVGAWQP